MSKWIGYAVSVNCGDPLGCYQGTILQADGLTITLTKAFRNGFPYPKSQVTLNAADVKELKIIEPRGLEGEQLQSTVAVSKSTKKCQRATVSESLQSNPTSSDRGSSKGVGTGTPHGHTNTLPGSAEAPASPPSMVFTPTHSKPLDVQTQGRQIKNNTIGGFNSCGPLICKRDRARKRNEACFGAPGDDPALAHDFDFEKNLALFDKHALWEQMRNSQKPDLLRQTGECGGGGGSFRHDENVLSGGKSPGDAQGGALRAIQVPDEERGHIDYVTDEGVVVPSVSSRLRRRLFDLLERHGLQHSADLLLARATADLALRLVGGGRRLDPRNAHQVPTVVVLVGDHREGGCGVCAGRLLASHGVRVSLLLVTNDRGGCGESPSIVRELSLYRSAHLPIATRVADLPTPDLVLLALEENATMTPPTHTIKDSRQRHLANDAVSWVSSCRACVVCVDPPGGGVGVNARASVVSGLPLAHAPSNGRLYLANAAIPVSIFARLHIQYRPPFGASSLLALHPPEDH